MTLPNKYPLVHVEWEDAEHNVDWANVEEDEKHEMSTYHSVGFLTHENETRICIASAYCPITDTVGNRQFIMRKMITKVEVLRGKKREKRQSEKPRSAEPSKDSAAS